MNSSPESTSGAISSTATGTTRSSPANPRNSGHVIFRQALRGRFSGQEANTLVAYDYLSTCATQGEALWTLLGGHEASAFELFSKLVELHQAGLFDDVELRLRRHSKPAEESD